MGNWLASEKDFPITIRKTSKYGWKRDLPDRRDIWLRIPAVQTFAQVDLRNQWMPKVYNQGSLGSCTANAIAGAFEYDQKKQELEDFMPSRLFIYFNERAIEGTVDQDSGASIRDGMKVLNKLGVCPEKDCPYQVEYFNIKPAESAYIDAQKHKSLSYKRIRPNVRDFRTCLHFGFPIIFGFSVPESFESSGISTTGVMKMPDPNEKVLGGHAVLACGYDDNKEIDGEKGFVLVRNSWSSDWGQGGYFWMPYSFINATTCDDCWILQRVVEKEVVVEKTEGVNEVNEEKEEPEGFNEDPEGFKEESEKAEKKDDDSTDKEDSIDNEKTLDEPKEGDERVIDEVYEPKEEVEEEKKEPVEENLQSLVPRGEWVDTPALSGDSVNNELEQYQFRDDFDE